MRVYLGADAPALDALRDGAPLPGERVVAESEDEEHELEALLRAADLGPVVAVAEVAAPDDAVTLDRVVAWHVDPDGSGDLAWFATQELEAVLAVLGS